MNVDSKYYAIIKVLFDLDIDNASLFVKLNESDKRKIIRTLKKLKTSMNVEYNGTEGETVTFEINLDNCFFIKIVNEQLYVSHNDVMELLTDENNILMDIILGKALKKNYDDISKLMRILYAPKPKRRNSIKSFKE